MRNLAVILATLLAGCAFRTIPPMIPPPLLSPSERELVSGACADEALSKATYNRALGDAINAGILAAMLGAASGAAVGAAVGGEAAYGAKIGAASMGPSGFVYGAMTSRPGVHRREFNKAYFHCMLRAGYMEARR